MGASILSKLTRHQRHVPATPLWGPAQQRRLRDRIDALGQVAAYRAPQPNSDGTLIAIADATHPEHPAPWRAERASVYDSHGRLVANAHSEAAAAMIAQAPRMAGLLWVFVDCYERARHRPIDPGQGNPLLWDDLRAALACVGQPAPEPLPLEPEPQSQPQRAERTPQERFNLFLGLLRDTLEYIESQFPKLGDLEPRARAITNAVRTVLEAAHESA